MAVLPGREMQKNNEYFQFIEDLSDHYGRQKYNVCCLSHFCRLRISFKWMVRAFSGYLATDQLLLLWDRILGYNSLEILAGNVELFLQNMLSPGGCKANIC